MKAALLAPLALLLVANAARAHDWHRFVDGERAPLLRAEAMRNLAAHRVPWAPRPPSEPAVLDVLSRNMDVDVDPITGAVDATISVRIRAQGASLDNIGFGFSTGLSVSSITVGGVPATVSSGADGSYAYAGVSFPTPLAAGAETDVVMRYAGTVDCSDGERCSIAAGFSHFTIASIFPYVYEQNGNSLAFDGATTELTLRTTPGIDAVVSAELVESRSEAGRAVTTWRVPRPVNHGFGFYAFLGTLLREPVAGRPVETELIGRAGASPNTAKLQAWSKEALEFVEASSLPLPFGQQWLVRLPEQLSDPGTVSYGMTLLNDFYGDYGDAVYQETWVHENAHLAWAIAVPEIEGTQTRMFTEGMATLTEIEFTARRFPEEPRDAYLARRYQNIRLSWTPRGGLEELAPVFASEAKARQLLYSGSPEYSGWAYEKSAATLDHLRAAIGDEPFLRAQKKYATQFAFTGGTLDDFRSLLEAESGIALGTTFERWITKTSRPQLRIGFAKTAAGTELAIDKDDDLAVPLQLWVEDASGARSVLFVTAEGRSTRLPAPAGVEVFSVRPNPRLGVLAQMRSTVAGDMNFDGQADGKDLLACASHFGETFAASTSGPGLWLLDVHFPVECDRNDDGTIDDADWADLEAGFESEGVAP